MAVKSQRRQAILWCIWILCVGLWTCALLTTFPVHVKDAVLAPATGYDASKLLHVSAYAFLAGFAAWLLPGNRYRWLLILFLSCHAGATEYLQQFVEARHASLIDVGINHIGIALGLLLTVWKWLPHRG